jgi:polysaccharide pyruvyl transferase WcaK-like protein
MKIVGEKMAKIMLHGATMGTNFGDFIFAKLFYDRVKDLNRDGETYFYESKYAMSDFFKKQLKYSFNYSRNSLLKSDALVYISGGYFGERKQSLKESILRFLRYMVVGCYFVLRKKPIAIIGVGAGPLSNRFLKLCCKKIFNHASVITVRDNESKEYLKEYGVNKNIIVTTDSAQILSYLDFPKNIKQWVEGEFVSSKYIFLHINPGHDTNIAIINKIVKPLNTFLKRHSEFGVIVGCDQYSHSKEELNKIKNCLVCENILLFDYNEPMSLCSVLNKVDLIITTKLHVGIIGVTCAKSVVSISGHSEKILRYYKQINESNRAIKISNCNNEMVLDLLERYYNTPIILDDKIFDLAKSNFEALNEFIQNVILNSKYKINF